MTGKRLKFGDKEMNKSNFSNNIKPFEINNIDFNKIKVSQIKNYATKKINHINILLGMMIMIS